MSANRPPHKRTRSASSCWPIRLTIDWTSCRSMSRASRPSSARGIGSGSRESNLDSSNARTAASTSLVARGSPHRDTTIPPIKQAGRPLASRKLNSSCAASTSGGGVMRDRRAAGAHRGPGAGLGVERWQRTHDAIPARRVFEHVACALSRAHRGRLTRSHDNQGTPSSRWSRLRPGASRPPR